MLHYNLHKGVSIVSESPLKLNSYKSKCTCANHFLLADHILFKTHQQLLLDICVPRQTYICTNMRMCITRHTGGTSNLSHSLSL